MQKLFDQSPKNIGNARQFDFAVGCGGEMWAQGGGGGGGFLSFFELKQPFLTDYWLYNEAQSRLVGGVVMMRWAATGCNERDSRAAGWMDESDDEGRLDSTRLGR